MNLLASLVLGSTLISPLTVRHNPVPMVRALESMGFVVQFVHENPFERSATHFRENGLVRMQAGRSADKFQIRSDAAAFTAMPPADDKMAAFRRWRRLTTAAPIRFDEQSRTYSGFPIGQKFHVGPPGRTQSQASHIWVFSDNVMVDVSGLSNRVQSVGGRTVGVYPEDSAKILECVARWQMGTLEAFVGEARNFTLGGQSLKGMQIGEHSFVSGEALCKAKGWEPLVHEMSAQLRFTTPKGKVIVPLASPEVQLGGARLRYGGITVAVGYDIYVPLGLARAVW